MGKAEQKNQIEIGPVKITPLERKLTHMQQRQIGEFIGGLLSFVVNKIRLKRGERLGKFDMRLGSTIRRLLSLADDIIDSPVPTSKDGKMKLAKAYAKNISAILKDGGIPANMLARLRIEVEGELLEVFFGMKALDKKKLPVFMKKTGPVGI